jgi:hypothetical protein
MEPAPRLRFVVLHHTGIPNPHFDLMFEDVDDPQRLISFRSPIWPIRSRVEVEMLPFHRRAYLDYEGQVSGGRGSVRRASEGVYSYFRSSLPGDDWLVRLRWSDGSGILSFISSGGSWTVEPVAVT